MNNETYMSFACDHDIVTVSVSHPQHVCRHTITSTREGKAFDRLVQTGRELSTLQSTVFRRLTNYCI